MPSFTFRLAASISSPGPITNGQGLFKVGQETSGTLEKIQVFYLGILGVMRV